MAVQHVSEPLVCVVAELPVSGCLPPAVLQRASNNLWGERHERDPSVREHRRAPLLIEAPPPIKIHADDSALLFERDFGLLANVLEPRVAAEEFQVWKLTVRQDRSAALTCEDGNGHVVFAKEIPFTDFPLDEITLWFANDTIYLPSEH